MSDKNTWYLLYPVLDKIEAARYLPPDVEDNDALLNLRSQTRMELGFAKEALGETLSERESFLILFPLVVYFDELVQTRCLDPAARNWPALQTELYEIDNGGDLFYETLDELIKKTQTLPVIYEVFHFCLTHGFTGRYRETPEKIAACLTELKKRIPTEPVNAAPGEEIDIVIPPGRPVVLYYAASFAAVIGFYFLLAWGRPFS